MAVKGLGKIAAIIETGIFLVLLLNYSWWSTTDAVPIHRLLRRSLLPRAYNTTYPFTPPTVSGDNVIFRFGIVTDLDKDARSSKYSNTYNSYFKQGSLAYNVASKSVDITWDIGPVVLLKSSYAFRGRGMELSELVVYDGRLLTIDDKSGFVFEILNNRMIPWAVLPDGDGHMDKGMKAEWATVKDELLYIGSTGKELTTPTGELINFDPMWVKVLNMRGEVQHVNWTYQYRTIRSAAGIEFPGYIWHETGMWSPHKKLWYFLPRKCSRDIFNSTAEGVVGCNYLISADADFQNASSIQISDPQPRLGYSSFKFIPGTNDDAIVALKTTEFEGQTSTYIAAFTTDGTILLPDTLIENLKYEGLEFL